MTSTNRTAPCTIRDARQRLWTARAYLEVAELVLGEDQEEYAGVAAGNAVLAGIAAADANCGKGLRRRFRGDDHRQAAELHETTSSDGTRHRKTLLRLLDLKDAAHCGFGDFSKTEARKAVRLSRELVTGADAFFEQ
jgi:hypothetical protein